ncbi:MAG: YtxH domain-containing protein [Chloroflexi bacterium]|nr:YtxH domain-containing protein [Chloroflexota bacterium]
MRKGWVFVCGAVVGSALGWIAGVLSAPRSGQDTMNAISEKAIELSNIMGFSGAPGTPQTAPEAAKGADEEGSCEIASEEVDLTAGEKDQ